MVKVNAHGIQGDAARWIRIWLVGRRQRIAVVVVVEVVTLRTDR